MIINSFPKIVKNILEGLPKNDYPVLNSRLFVECWLAYALDNSLRSMPEVLNVKILRIVSKLCIGIGDTKFYQLMTLFSIDNGFYLGKTQRL
jgi:hypothetical protein